MITSPTDFPVPVAAISRGSDTPELASARPSASTQNPARELTSLNYTQLQSHLPKHGFAHLGYCNGWTTTPSDLQKCRDTGHKTTSKKHSTAERYIDHCPICKIYFLTDAS